MHGFFFIYLGQGNISTRKQVTFGSPLQDIHQVSQNGQPFVISESVINNTFNKELIDCTYYYVLNRLVICTDCVQKFAGLSTSIEAMAHSVFLRTKTFL